MKLIVALVCSLMAPVIIAMEQESHRRSSSGSFGSTDSSSKASPIKKSVSLNTSPSSSPIGSRLSRSLKKDPDFFELQKKIAQVEKEKAAFSEEKIKEHYDKIPTEEALTRQRALQQIVSLNISHPSPTKLLASEEVLKVCLHDIVIGIKNFHMFKKQKNEEEAKGQFSFVMQQYYNSRAALIAKIKNGDSTLPDHMCQHEADKRLAMIRKRMESYLEFDYTNLELREFDQEMKSIKEEDFQL